MESLLVKAELVYVSPELSRVSAAAMRSCYSSWPAHRLFLDREAFPESEVSRMLNKAVELGHLDVLEHGFASWLVEAGSDEVLEALIRHRFVTVSRLGPSRWLVTTTVRSLLEYKRSGGRLKLMEALLGWLPKIAPWLGEKIESKHGRQEPQLGYPEGAEVWLLSYTDFSKLGEVAGDRIGAGQLGMHGGFTFSISGVSRSFTHQLVRHRLAAYSQQSQRHVKVARGERWYGTPPKLPEGLREEYDRFMAGVASFYHKLIESGARKEDARFVLPNATLTHITMTASAWEYEKMFSLRVDPAAQWEIRDVSWAMLALSMLVAPELFEKLSEPAWLSQEVREKFGAVKEAVEEARESFEKLGRGSVMELKLPGHVLVHKVKAYAVKH